MPSLPYVHGYSPRKSVRLGDQAQTLVDLLHHDEIHPAGSLILEAGCGIGAQTVILARNNPTARILSVDRSPESLAQARRATEAAGLANVRFEPADIMGLP
jgi:tRNA G46 methylase TrmB